jgi:hypothetical protein
LRCKAYGVLSAPHDNNDDDDYVPGMGKTSIPSPSGFDRASDE